MASLKPPIKTTATSNRVSKEKRNVRVKAFIYAASHENDNDFHLIVGGDPAKLPEVYMTMELSGLPPKTATSHAKLKSARDAYKGFFHSNVPGMAYDFYDPPIPIQVEGSLFFDISHARKRKRRSPRRRSERQTSVGIPRSGMPSADSVKEVVPFTSPTGRPYRIIKTSEIDAYDRQPKPTMTKQSRHKQ
jgi:hypothetical protein